MTGALLIYGPNGYTGELTARFAAERKQQAIVAGRSAERVRAVADRYRFEHRVFGLDDPEALVAGLAGVEVVLHCAGPFSRTSKPMIDACLAARAHYLDITGWCLSMKSASGQMSALTFHGLTRVRIDRLDAIIAHPEEQPTWWRTLGTAAIAWARLAKTALSTLSIEDSIVCR